MISLKSQIFNYLSKSQKSELCHYVAAFVKKNGDKSPESIMNLYIEEETYYINLDSSRHPWLVDFLDTEEFYKDLKLYINECVKKLEYQEKQKPFVEKQKQIAKEQRKKAQEFKMNKEPPTKKQIYYYKALCKKYSIDENIINLEQVSKLDLKNAIDILLSLNTDKNTLIKSLKSTIQKDY